MATTMPWLSGFPAARLGRRAAHVRAVSASPGPALAPGERVLLTGDRLVATDRALYSGAGEWARLGWEQVVRADPHERGLMLTAWAPGLPPRTVLAVERPARLLALARERIAWTALLTTRAQIGGRPARIAARRQPGPGTLVWMVALDPEVTPTPAVRAELAAALAGLHREFPRP